MIDPFCRFEIDNKISSRLQIVRSIVELLAVFNYIFMYQLCIYEYIVPYYIIFTDYITTCIQCSYFAIDWFGNYY